MTRLLAFAVVATLGNAPVALAQDSLLKTGTRHAQQLARTAAAAPMSPAQPVGAPLRRPGATPAAAAQPGGGSLQSSGLRRRSKVLIALGIAAGVTAGILAIDGGVEDFTPSTLGTRRD